MKSLIFDFDGVLGDTFNVSAEFIAKQSRISLARAKRILISDGMKNQKDSFLYRLIRNFYYKRLLLFFTEQGSLLFDDRLKEIETKWAENPKAVLTRSDGRICRALLGKYEDMFEFVIGRERVNTKLDGLNIVTLSSRFKVDNCIFFTDSIGDYKEMSKFLKDDQIYLVGWGFQPRELLEKFFAKEKIIDSFNEVNF